MKHSDLLKFKKKKGSVLKEDNLWTASILKDNGLQEVFKFQCIFSNCLNCAMWINTSRVFIFSDLISSDLFGGQYLSLRIWGIFIIIISLSVFSHKKTVHNDPFSQFLDSKNTCRIQNVLFLSEIPGHFCQMSMSASLRSLKCGFLWGTWEECPDFLGRRMLDRLPWEEDLPGWARGRSQDSIYYRVQGKGEQLNISKGKALLVAVSSEPIFCLLFFINIPLVLLMGKKVKDSFFWHYLRSCRCFWIRILAFFIGRK